MKRKERIYANSLNSSDKIITMMKVINNQILKFVQDIVIDCGVNTDNLHYKLDLEDMCYKLLLYNSETGTIIGKAWPMAEFLETCSANTMEFELNTIVRVMLLKLEDKKRVNGKGETIPIWI